MNEVSAGSAPPSHWVISGTALAWNLLGLAMYVMTVSAAPEQLASQYTAAELAYVESIPAWASAANAVAVITGVVACLLLLMRKAMAVPLLILSLLTLLIQDMHAFVLSDSVAVFGPVPLYIQGCVLLIAVALVFYARSARSRGILT